MRGHDSVISVCAGFTFCAALNSSGGTCFHSCHEIVVAVEDEVDELDCGVVCVDAALDEEVVALGGAVICVTAALVGALVGAAAEFTAAASGNFTVTSERFTYTRPRP